MPHERRYKKASSRIAKRERVRKILRLVLSITLPTSVLLLLVVLARAEFMQIKNFEVVGGEVTGREKIENSASSFASGTKFFFIPKSNIFILDKDQLASALLSEFGRLNKVEVNKSFFSKTVKLSVDERKSDYIWCSKEEECFYMDKNGLVFEKLQDDQFRFVMDQVVFKGVLEGNPLMKNFATPEKMQNYLKLIDSLKSSGFEASSIIIESNDKALAGTNIGNIIFDPEEKDLPTVVQNVTLLINEIKTKTPSSNFEYVDARFGNKIFYKLAP